MTKPSATRPSSPHWRAAAVLLGAGLVAGSLVLGGHTGPATAAVPHAQVEKAAAPQAAPQAALQAVSSRPVVYLTFDDGPDTTYTPQVLYQLKRYGAKATFFELGRKVRDHGTLTKAVRWRGHSVQNHTWDHADLTKVSWQKFVNEVVSTDRAIYAQLHYKPRCLRPPYGAMNSVTKRRAAAMDKTLKVWTIDTRDWQRPGTSTIVKRALSGVRSGSIILMHDGGGNRSQTVAATATIIKTLKARGYTFGTLWC